MTPDQVIEKRKLWAGYDYGPRLPAATVLAERDWTAYVLAMAAMVPKTDGLIWPTEAEVAWAWPDGVTLMFAEPVEVAHTITSNQGRGLGVSYVEPHTETQVVAGIAVCAPTLAPTMSDTGEPGPSMAGVPLLWIGVEPEDLITGWWLPGSYLDGTHVGGISQSTNLLVSVVSALGHRLTRLDMPGGGRGERRRVERELPGGLRVLQLSSGASVTRSEGKGTVEWSHRWMVRGHWRQQPCGPKRQLRRMTWIDPFVKGPEDKPLDVRPTIWRTGAPTQEGR